MDGVPHRVFAAGSWLLLSAATHRSGHDALAGLVGSQLMASGKTSPDLDHAFEGEILGHRRLLHWWGWPVLALAFTPLPFSVFWGWFSHIVADFIFGKAGYGRDKGVPMLLWFGHAGLGLKSGQLNKRAWFWFFGPVVRDWKGRAEKLPTCVSPDRWFAWLTLAGGAAAVAWS